MTITLPIASLFAKVPTIWTIGHSDRTQAELLAMLKAFKIKLVADVRSSPSSRKYPQFDRDALAKWLPEAGIRYETIADLGGHRESKEFPGTDSAWHNPSFGAYAEYMATPPFRRGLTKLLHDAAGKNVAIMCSEAVWWRCHRSMISDALTAGGVNVEHIMSLTDEKQHPGTAVAHIGKRTLNYGKPGDDKSLAGTPGHVTAGTPTDSQPDDAEVASND